jgi:ABC-2 type transport system permease protein
MSSPTGALIRTEFRLFLREPGALFWIMAFPSLLIGLLGLVPAMKEPIGDLGGVPLIALYVPIAILMAMLFAGVSTMPVVLATYREQRILRRIATTPARPAHLLFAQFAIHASAAVLGGALALTLANVVHDVPLPDNTLAYLLVLLLILAVCLAVGALVAGLAKTTKVAATLGSILLFPLMFTAGVWMPVQAMPGVLGDLVSWTPLGAAALALQEAAAGFAPSWEHLAVISGWLVVLWGLAIRSFRWE